MLTYCSDTSCVCPTPSSLANNVRKVAAVRFFFWLHLFASIIVPFFRDWGGLNFTEILLLQAWFMAWNFVLEVPTGAVADFFGRRVSMSLAGVMVAVGSAVYASVPWLPVFLLGEFIFAIAMTLMSGADEALVYDTLKALGREREATRTISALESWKLAGIVLGALASGILAAKVGLRAPLLLQCVPALISTCFALTLVEPPKGESDGMRDSSLRRYFAIVSGGIGHLWRHPELRALTLDSVLTGTITWLIIWSFPPQLERSGITISAFGVVQAAMALGQIALLSRQHRVERLVGGIVPLLRITALLPPLGFLLLAMTSHPVGSVMGILVVSVPGLARGPLFSGALNRHIRSTERATVLSSISAARTLAIAVVYPVAGSLMDRSLPLAFAAFGSINLVTAIFCAAPAAAITGGKGEE